MSEPKSKDEMTADELREDALEHGLTMDDAPVEDPIPPAPEKKSGKQNDGDGKSDR